jgi:hypothetical protein
MRNFRARGHRRDRNIHRHATNSLPAVGKTNSSSRASRKVKIRPALQDCFEIFIKKSSCLKSKLMMERLRSYSFKNCSSAKVTDLWRGALLSLGSTLASLFPRASMEIGVNLKAASLWRQVFRENGQWLVQSGNDAHALRTRPRSLAGAIAFRRTYAGI